jgi:hypothetical protein
MAYINVYDNDYGKITLDRDNNDRIINAIRAHSKLSDEVKETLEEIFDKIGDENIEVDDVDVYLRQVHVSTDDIEEAYDDYCDNEDTYEDGYEKGLDDGLSSASKNMRLFRNENWKILSKLEKYAYFNEENKLTKDDAKDILDIFNSI